jgi:hypothetical protein
VSVKYVFNQLKIVFIFPPNHIIPNYHRTGSFIFFLPSSPPPEQNTNRGHPAWPRMQFSIDHRASAPTVCCLRRPASQRPSPTQAPSQSPASEAASGTVWSCGGGRLTDDCRLRRGGRHEHGTGEDRRRTTRTHLHPCFARPASLASPKTHMASSSAGSAAAAAFPILAAGGAPVTSG